MFATASSRVAAGWPSHKTEKGLEIPILKRDQTYPSSLETNLPHSLPSRSEDHRQHRQDRHVSPTSEELEVYCRDLKELVHHPGGVLAHILEDVGVPPESHGRV